jgi:hypothetical protein
LGFNRCASERTGLEIGVLTADFCNCAVKMHGPDYGQIVPWEKDKAHRWDIIGSPRARLGVEAQTVLMGFLRKTVERLLENVSCESLSAKWQGLVNDRFRKSSEQETWMVFSNMAFLWPPKFSPDYLLDFAVARSANAQDHLWLLQTDLPYLRGEVRYFRKSSFANALQDRTSEDAVFGWVGSNMIKLPNTRVYEWHHIVEECAHVRGQHQKFRDSIHFGVTLPKRYAEALGTLEVSIIIVLQTRVNEVRQLLSWLQGRLRDGEMVSRAHRIQDGGKRFQW